MHRWLCPNKNAIGVNKIDIPFRFVRAIMGVQYYRKG